MVYVSIEIWPALIPVAVTSAEVENLRVIPFGASTFGVSSL